MHFDCIDICLHCPAAGFALVGVAAAYQLWTTAPATTQALCEEADEHEFENWSATHRVRPKHLYQPETTQELQQVVADCHASGGAYMLIRTIHSHPHIMRPGIPALCWCLRSLQPFLHCTVQVRGFE